MLVLGIDPSYTLGWAIVDTTDGFELKNYGAIVSKHNKNASSNIEAVLRVQELARPLADLMAINNIKRIAVEIATGNDNYHSVRMFGRMDGMVGTLGVCMGAQVFAVTPQQVKEIGKYFPMGLLPENVNTRKATVVNAVLNHLCSERTELRRKPAWFIEAVCDAVAVVAAANKTFIPANLL